MNTVKDKVARATRHLALVLLASLVLVACSGGGGSGGTPPTANLVEGSVVAGVTVLSDTQNSQISAIQPNADGTLSVTAASGVLGQFQAGQIVTIPANEALGLPYGYAGKVVTISSGQLQMAPAATEDVFTKLKVDIDTTRDGATIAGVFAAPGTKVSIQQASDGGVNQAGVTNTSCVMTPTGLTVSGGIACNNGLLSGEITISHDFTVNKKDGTGTAVATLFGTIKISNGKVIYQADFDPAKYTSSDGWGQLKSVVQADVSASVGIRTPSDINPQLNNIDTPLEIPSMSELLRKDGRNIWDKSWKLGEYLEISGLNGDDKKGLIPLAGIIIAPTSPTGKPFTGDLNAHQLGFYAGSSAVILWVYMDASGSITLQGEADLLRLDNMHVERGYELQVVGNKLVGQDINKTTAPTVTAPYIKGSAEVKQTVGLTLAADILVGGIRPMTIKAQAIAATLSSNVEGEGGYQFYPQPQWVGSLCYGSSASIDSNLSVLARIKAKLDVGWVDLKGTAEFSQDWPLNWYKAELAPVTCISNPALDMSVALAGGDPSDSTKSLVRADFSASWNTTAIRNIVDTWTLTATPSGGTPLAVDVPASSAGKYNLSLSKGYRYNVELSAKNNMGAALPSVIRSIDIPLAPVSVTIPTGISATAGNGQATISWDTVAGVSYNLYMASVSGVTRSNYNSLTDGMQHTGVTSPYTHTGLTNGKTYYFVVTAVNSSSESSESSQVSATPQAAGLTDTTPPTVDAFRVSPSTNTLGQSFTISYTVSDSGGSGLKQIGLWRANISGASNDSSWAQIGSGVSLSGNGPYSSTFTDAPPIVGNYWYGIHVIDNANPTVIVHESVPLSVTVTSPITSSCTEVESNDSSFYANPLTLNVGCTGKIYISTDKDWFDIYVSSGTTITFNLQVPAGLDYDMALYGPTATNSSQHWLVDGNLYGAGQPETITYTTTATGYFAVQIYGYAGAFSPSSTYTITRTK